MFLPHLAEAPAGARHGGFAEGRLLPALSAGWRTESHRKLGVQPLRGCRPQCFLSVTFDSKLRGTFWVTQSSVEVGREEAKGKTASGHWPGREGSTPVLFLGPHRASVGCSLRPGMASVPAGRDTAPRPQFIVEFTGSERLQSPPTAHNGLGAEPGEGPMCLIPFSIPTHPVVNGRPKARPETVSVIPV